MGRPMKLETRKKIERYGELNESRKFTPEQHMEIARRIAWFWPNQQIMEFVKQTYKIAVTPLAIVWIRNSDRWTPIIEKFRDDYVATLSEIPLFHKKKRLEELQEQYDYYKSKNMRDKARSIIREFREEAEGKRGDISFNFTQVTHNEFHDMTDEDLQKEKVRTLEELEKVRKLKLLAQEGVQDGVGS